MACDVNCHCNSQLLFYVASATRQSGIYVWHYRLYTRTSIHCTVYTYPLCTRYWYTYNAIRVRTVQTYCTNVYTYVHTVRRYCIELQYQPEGDSQLTWIYVAPASASASIYAQNLRCTCNSMPFRDENDGTCWTHNYALKSGFWFLGTVSRRLGAHLGYHIA